MDSSASDPHYTSSLFGNVFGYLQRPVVPLLVEGENHVCSDQMKGITGPEHLDR